MKIPAAELARIEPAKVRDYLLSPEHPVGRFKAAFFGALGYRRENWQQLQQDLLSVLRSGQVLVGQTSAFGQKYEVRGTIQGPLGRRAKVVTVWIILERESAPRFVTAFPGAAR